MQRIRKKKLKTYHVNSKLFRLSLLHSIPTKKNLNFLPKESKKRKKLISHETHFNSPNPPQLQNMSSPSLTAVQNSTSTPIILVIKSFRASLRYFSFSFFFPAISLWPVTGEEERKGRLQIIRAAKRNDLSSQQVALARVNCRKGLATTQEARWILHGGKIGGEWPRSIISSTMTVSALSLTKNDDPFFWIERTKRWRKMES